MYSSNEYLKIIIEDALLVQIISNSIFTYDQIIDDFLCTFLRQEMKLYNNLIVRMSATLKSLLNVITQQTQPSKDDLEIRNAIIKNEVPESWILCSYPFFCSLKSYIQNLNRRIFMMQKWWHYGCPSILWLPGIFNIRSYFTILRLNFARYVGVSLMDVHLVCTTTGFEKAQSRSKDWVSFYKGCILIGGQINISSGYVEEANADRPINTLPILWIEPVLAQNVEVQCIRCPFYYVFKNVETSSEFLIENFIINLYLSTNKCEVLTRRGVKLILTPWFN